MSRPVRIALAAVLLLVALLGVPVGLSMNTITYSLNTDAGVVRRTAGYLPGRISSVLALTTAVATVAWLVVNVRREPRPGLWLFMVGLVVVDIAVLGLVSDLPRPTF